MERRYSLAYTIHGRGTQAPLIDRVLRNKYEYVGEFLVNTSNYERSIGDITKASRPSKKTTSSTFRHMHGMIEIYCDETGKRAVDRHYADPKPLSSASDTDEKISK